MYTEPVGICPAQNLVCTHHSCTLLPTRCIVCACVCVCHILLQDIPKLVSTCESFSVHSSTVLDQHSRNKLLARECSMQALDVVDRKAWRL